MQTDRQKLEDLKSKILGDLTAMSDQLVDNDDVGFEALLALGRSTGNVNFLEKALKKAETMDDSLSKSDALLDLLDEVEIGLRQPPEPEADQSEEEPSEEASSEPEEPAENN